jgi:hypothetical protein
LNYALRKISRIKENLMMKYFFAILPAFILLLSCTTTQTGTDGLRVREYRYAYEKMVFDDYLFEFEFTLSALEGDKEIEAAIKNLIYNGKEPDAYVEHKANLVLGELKKEGSLLRLAEGENINRGEYAETVRIKSYGDSFVILRRDTYLYYSGQAHGISLTEYFVLDLDEGRILSPGDLVSAVPEDILKSNIASKFNIDFNYRQSIWPPDTISLEREGLLLFWNVYSIAPYSGGPIEITLPYSIVNGYLTAKARLIRDKL